MPFFKPNARQQRRPQRAGADDVPRVGVADELGLIEREDLAERGDNGVVQERAPLRHDRKRDLLALATSDR